MDLQVLKKVKPKLAERKVEAETVLVPLSGNVADLNEMFTLNEVGSFIWDRLDELNSTDEIVASVLSEFEVGKKEAQQDVKTFLDELSQFVVKNK
jgi:hypothetical protein